MDFEFIKGIQSAINGCIANGRGHYDMGTGVEIYAEWEEWEPERYIVRVYILENGINKFDIPIGETLTAD